jgi:hypothetical protein
VRALKPPRAAPPDSWWLRRARASLCTTRKAVQSDGNRVGQHSIGGHSPNWVRIQPALTEQIAVFDKAVQQQVGVDPICRLLMTVPGIGAPSSLRYVSRIEDPARFSRSRAVGAHLGLTLPVG